MPKHDWRRPSAEEAARGVLAVLISPQTMRLKGADIAFTQCLPYTAQMLERRNQRGGSLPYFITMKQEERVMV